MVESKAHMMGHPLHPMLIPFPVALYPLALVLDLVWLWRQEALWLGLASWSLAAALVSTLVAAVPGYIDYRHVVRAREARRTATQHLVNGLAIALLALVAVALRAREGAFALSGEAERSGLLAGTVGLTAALNLLLVWQGWLGGELVYRHHIGVEPEAGPASPAPGRVGGATRPGGGAP